jgi:hypothetical protein
MRRFSFVGLFAIIAGLFGAHVMIARAQDTPFLFQTTVCDPAPCAAALPYIASDGTMYRDAAVIETAYDQLVYIHAGQYYISVYHGQMVATTAEADFGLNSDLIILFTSIPPFPVRVPTYGMQIYAPQAQALCGNCATTALDLLLGVVEMHVDHDSTFHLTADWVILHQNSDGTMGLTVGPYTENLSGTIWLVKIGELSVTG